MQNFIRRPLIDLFAGIRVHEDTVIDFENENVKQTLKDLTLHTITTLKGDGFESVYDVTIHLNEGDILLLEEEGRGYIKPTTPFVSIEEAIEDLESIKDLGGGDVQN
jgi:hypothetical protein